MSWNLQSYTYKDGYIWDLYIYSSLLQVCNIVKMWNVQAYPIYFACLSSNNVFTFCKSKWVGIVEVFYGLSCSYFTIIIIIYFTILLIIIYYYTTLIIIYGSRVWWKVYIHTVIILMLPTICCVAMLSTQVRYMLTYNGIFKF